ncbi:hypothetical protein NE237_001083 [Protea cynaroides]|uniref:Uncharacterized protein n=1 Tax=Protea cynaroides TaxID=273540 RepID=A0A9Q0KSM9_9MAGN|nr:hypothetical protein NE237_001083 [Protea cynaroides]
MEHFDSWESSSSSRDEKLGPLELLEDNWFFNNLFHRKPAMVRRSSDPTPSQEISVKMRSGDKISSSMPELLWISRDDSRNQQPSSMAQNISSGKQQMQKEPKVDDNPDKDIENPCDKQSSSLPEELEDDGSVHQKLVGAPLVPHTIGKEKLSIHGSRKLMRQGSHTSSSVLPPQHNSKSMIPSLSIPRNRREAKVDITQHDSNRTLSRWKTMNDLEIEELQGFKDLGFRFNNEDLDSSMLKIIPGLRDRSQANLNEDKVRRPYLSEAWLLQRSSVPLMPNWADRRSVGDMKEHLKFWAQVVASNVR